MDWARQNRESTNSLDALNRQAMAAASQTAVNINLNTGAIVEGGTLSKQLSVSHPDIAWDLDRLAKYVYEKDRDHFLNQLESSEIGSDTLSIPFRIHVEAGSLRWFELRGRKSLDEHTDVVCFEGVLMDVRDNKDASGQMGMYRRQIERAEEVAQLGYWQYYFDSNELKWSDQVYEMFGLEKQVPIDFSVFMEMVHPDDRDKLVSAQQTARRDGSKMNVQYRLQRQDGSIGFYREIGEIYDDPVTGESLFGGVIMDATPEMEYKQMLEASERKYRQQFEEAPYGILLSAPDGRIFEANKAAQDMLGYTQDEICRLGRKGLVDSDSEINRRAVQIRKKTGQFEGKMDFINADGERMPVDLTSCTYEDYEGRQRALVLFRDLTRQQSLEREIQELLRREQVARRHAEVELSRIQEMFDQAPSAISLVQGSDHRFVYANEEYQKLVNGRAKEGMPCAIALPELARQGFVDVLDRVRKSGNVEHGREVTVELQQPNSDQLEERTFNYLYKPLQGSNDYTDAIFIEIVDVTEESRAKQQIRASLKEKTVLLQEMHHRVKNNLALISSMLDLQIVEQNDGQAKKSLIEARNRIFSISKIHELLYQDDNLAEVHFSNYVREIMSVMEGMDASISSNNYTINTLELEDISLSISKAIPMGLLLNELVTNAYEHAFPDQSKGEVFVGLRKRGDHIELQVKDNGIGLPNDSKLNGSKSLGWTLIETLVGQIRGEIDIRTPLEGTDIVIRIPV